MFKKLLGTILFTCATAFSASAVAQVVGYVVDVKGEVFFRDPGKQFALATAGDTFGQGADFRTGPDGQVSIKFEDGQLAVIAPNAHFVATTYVFNKTRVADSNIVFNLLSGGMRFVSGVIASTNREKFKVQAATATIGVRGSDGAIALGTPQIDPNSPYAQGQARIAAARAAWNQAQAALLATRSTEGLAYRNFLTATDALRDAVRDAPPRPPEAVSVLASTSKGAVTLQVGNTVVLIPVGAASFSVNGSGPSSPGTPVPPALAGVAALVRAVAVAPVTNNTPANPAAVAAAVKAAVAAAQNPGNAALQAAAQTALQAAITANQALVTTVINAGGVPAPTPATTPVNVPGTPAPAPALTQQELQLLGAPPPPSTLVVPSGS